MAQAWLDKRVPGMESEKGARGETGQATGTTARELLLGPSKERASRRAGSTGYPAGPGRTGQGQRHSDIPGCPQPKQGPLGASARPGWPCPCSLARRAPTEPFWASCCQAALAPGQAGGGGGALAAAAGPTASVSLNSGPGDRPVPAAGDPHPQPSP